MTTPIPAPVSAAPAPKKPFLSADSTKRALRTMFHGVVALIGAVPTIIVIAHLTHLDAQQEVATALTSLVVWSGVASKVLNQLEDAGLIPAWLKG
jgi:hypothetical protein